MKSLQAKESAREVLVAIASFPTLRHNPLSPENVRETTIAPIDPPATQSPYVAQLEVNCEECGGSGRDIGSLDPWDGDDCAKCAGTGRQTVTRNYLTEAFQISANPDSTRSVERQHLVAVIQHCRELVGALMSFPEVA